MLTMGLDLGRVRDPSALAALEPWRGRKVLVHLCAWRPTREDCSDAILDVLAFLDRNPVPGRQRIAIDGRNRTGTAVVAAALAGELGRRAEVFPILPSHSDRPHLQRPDGWTYVGKLPLVALLQRGIESGDLVLAKGLHGAEALRRELLRLTRMPTRRGGGWTWSHPDQKKGSHDDLTMAAAYAYWLAYTLETEGQSVRPANPRGDA